MLNALIGDLFFVNFGIDLIRPGVILFRKVRRSDRTTRLMRAPMCPHLCPSNPVADLNAFAGRALWQVLAKQARTQRRMNALYKMDSDIYLAFRLQLVCKFFFCGLVFSTAFPILYLICGTMFAAAGWIDRFNFLRVFAPPPPTGDRLIIFVARVITPFAVLGHTCMSFVFFRAIDVDRETGWSWASVLSLVAVSLTTGMHAYDDV